MSKPDTDEFKKFLLEKALDPSSGMTTMERTLYSLISLPKAAQEICTEQERETVIQNVHAAMEAAIKAALALPSA